MVHLLSHLDPMMYLMVIAFAIGFTVVAAVLVELRPDPADEPTLPTATDAAHRQADAPGEPGPAPPA
jgi:hypothetical protein